MLEACSAVPQTDAPSRAPKCKVKIDDICFYAEWSIVLWRRMKVRRYRPTLSYSLNYNYDGEWSVHVQATHDREKLLSTRWIKGRAVSNIREKNFRPCLDSLPCRPADSSATILTWRPAGRLTKSTENNTKSTTQTAETDGKLSDTFIFLTRFRMCNASRENNYQLQHFPQPRTESPGRVSHRFWYFLSQQSRYRLMRAQLLTVGSILAWQSCRIARPSGRAI
jgi:hypothetical protein